MILPAVWIIGAVFDFILGSLLGHYTVSSAIARRHLELDDDSVLLDVGGGTGGVAHGLDEAAGRVVVVEPSAPLVRRGRERYPRIHFVQGVGEALPIASGAVDAVLAVETLHHVADAPAMLAEVARVLRSGGRLLIEESEFSGRVSYVVRFWLERVFTNGVWPRSREELCALLAERGFDAQLLPHEGFVILARRQHARP
jgi:ubiquinone/menaquinone biosynthesis C-methylase UbiE